MPLLTSRSDVRVERCGDHVVPVLPDLGPDEGVDLVVPRGQVEERRVDGEVGVEGVDERAGAQFNTNILA